jgi:hypothetical protein
MRSNSGSGGLHRIRGTVAVGGGAWMPASAARTGVAAATTLAATPAVPA